jgi:hypothetical protein
MILIPLGLGASDDQWKAGTSIGDAGFVEQRAKSKEPGGRTAKA